MSGATVTTQIVRPNGQVWQTKTATTDANGWALFSQGTNGGSTLGTYSINVTGVSKNGATYNSAANVDATHQFNLN